MRDNFYSAYTKATLLFGVETLTPEDFEEMGLIAWNLIGNKQMRLYHHCAHVDCNDRSIELPCNYAELEAVTYDFEDWDYTSNKTINGNFASQFTEGYIEARKWLKSPYYLSGKFAKYELVNDTIYIGDTYNGRIHILYKGIEADEQGLPYLNEKESLAVATFVAWVKMRKEAYITRNAETMKFAQTLEQDWLKRCSQARVPESISQNDMNEILDASTNWNRKVFNKSFKPVK